MCCDARTFLGLGDQPFLPHFNALRLLSVEVPHKANCQASKCLAVFAIGLSVGLEQLVVVVTSVFVGHRCVRAGESRDVDLALAVANLGVFKGDR